MQQQDSRQPHYSLLRRWIFPYSGIEPLTSAQGRKVIITWATVFPIALLVCTLPLVAAFYTNAPVQEVGIILLAVLLGGMVLFALMAWFVVWAVNQTARTVKQTTFRRVDLASESGSESEDDTPSGDEYHR